MARRRANGEGTIYQRKDGRWEGAVYLQTVSGQRKRIRTYGNTAAEVRTALALQINANQTGVPVADTPLSVGTYLDYWLANIAKPNRRPKTYLLYELTVRLHIKPALGVKSLTRLSVAQVQEFLNSQLAAGRSIRTVHLIRTVLSAALTRAMREERIVRNVARLVELPPWRRKEIVPWTADQASEFLSINQDHPLYPAFLLLVLYGLRRGEVLGLRWEDVDEAERELHIRQQVLHVGSAVHIGPLKTEAGQRDLPLLDVASRALTSDRDKADRPTEVGNGVGLVFVSRAGTAIEPNNFGRRFQLAVAASGLPRVTPHHLRHTTATLLKNAGVPARDTQLILGHAHISTTQQLYQHGDLEGQRRGLSAIERALTAGLDGSRSRQILPSEQPIPQYLQRFQSGGPGGTRTLDILLKSHLQPTYEQRLTEVKLLARVRQRAWILGSAAVIFSRQQTTVGRLALAALGVQSLGRETGRSP
ncbi:MAG: site-specific recombinase XerD [Frankiales bacterium]|nr:site-specific recombinase XerD [Frankiales bacterium]